MLRHWQASGPVPVAMMANVTFEPGIYIPQEGFGVRLENDIVVTANGPVDLMASTPAEAQEIEELMSR